MPTPSCAFMRDFAIDRADGRRGRPARPDGLAPAGDAASRASSATARAWPRALGIDVVNRFRHADVAAGGEGAPFAPLYHRALAASLPQPVMVLNLGGVGNVTYIDGDTVIAFDTGPASALLDDFVLKRLGQRFDEDGALAASGTPDAALVARLMQHPYFQRPAPKSLDRNDFHAWAAAVEAHRRRRRRGDAGGVHGRLGRRRAAPCAERAAALAGDRRRPAQRHVHAHAAPRGSACRSIRSRPSAGTATSSRRSASATSRCARCAACRSACRRPRACRSPMPGGEFWKAA